MSGTINNPPTIEQTASSSKKKKKKKPKFYHAIHETIHEIHELGIFEFGSQLGLKGKEILDEVEIWVKEQENYFSKDSDIKEFFKKRIPHYP
ncbi:hypothetical protein Tco_0444003, partial [Tanacetum coccineum]